MRERRYRVQVASRSLTFYISETDNLERRVRQHNRHCFDRFTAQYKIVWPGLALVGPDREARSCRLWINGPSGGQKEV